MDGSGSPIVRGDENRINCNIVAAGTSGNNSRDRTIPSANDFAVHDQVGQRIIQAEKFKASIVPPPQGENVNVVNGQTNLINNGNDTNGQQVSKRWNADADDEFFHVTCHIDPNL